MEKNNINKIYPYHIGYFLLCVNKSQYFIVQRFLLSKAVGAIANCQMTVTDVAKDKILEANNVSIPTPGKIKLLYKLLEAHRGLLILCLLRLYVDGKSKKWFSGYVVSAAPSSDAEGGISTGMSIYGMGKACALMYALHSDFLYTPTSMASDQAMLLTIGIIGQQRNTSKTVFGSSKPIALLIAGSSQQKDSDDIATLLDKAFRFLQDWQKQMGLNNNSAVLIKDLLTYIQSDYRLSKAVQKIKSGISGGSDNAFIRLLNISFANNLAAGNIWLSIVASIGGDRLLTVVPSARLLKDIMRIIPSCINSSSVYTIQPKLLVYSAISINPLLAIRCPDKIYLRMTKTGAYSDLVPLKIGGIYGQYPNKSSNIKLNKNCKLKVLDAPVWLLNLTLLGALSLYDSQEVLIGIKNYLKDLTPKTLPKPKLTLKLKEDSFIDILDAYAQTVFYNTYLQDKMANIKLAVNDTNLDIDKLLGKTVKIKCPIGYLLLGSNLDSAQLFFGILTSVNYSYNSSVSPNQNSSITIGCAIRGLTDTSGKYASMFDQKAIKLLYQGK